MKKKKRIILMILLMIVLICISKLDKDLRFEIGLIDYYKYSAALTEEENEFIRKKDFLVGVYNYPPLAYTNEFNNYNTGIMVDYLSQLAIEFGGNIHIKAGSREYLMEALEKQEVDIIVIDNIAGEKTRKDISMSQPLSIVKSKILVKKNSYIDDIEDLNNKVLVTLEKDNLVATINEFFKDKINVEVIEVDNIYQGFALLNNEMVSGFVGDDIRAAHFIDVTNRGTEFKFLEPVLYEKEIALAVRKDNSELFSILNKGILQLKKKNLIVQTQYKWLGNFYTDGIDLRTIGITYRVLTMAILIIGSFSSWNYIITQRVNTKTRELFESKEELRLIIDTMKSGIMVIENNNIIVECNDAMVEITNTSRGNLIGFDYNNVQELKPFVNINNIDMILEIESNYYYITKQKITSNKSMIIIEDYTEKYLKEKKERQESKMIAVGQLSAGLAHEIRNPLGLVKSYAYIIEKHKINEICNHAILVINDSVNRINDLIENLLRFSRLSNDQTKLVNVEDLVNSIIDVERDNIKSKDINISRSFTGRYKDLISLNKDVLTMVLINLISNSIDSFKNVEKEHKYILLKVNVEADSLNISIIDNGCGIEKDKIDNIFDPFYSTKESGTGLGLYIISTEVSNNNGKISVDSNPEEGTVFNLVLPIMRLTI